MSGGYSPSLLDAMRFAITVSNVLSLTKPKSYKPLTVKDVLFMATLGGAQGILFTLHMLIFLLNLYVYMDQLQH